MKKRVIIALLSSCIILVMSLSIEALEKWERYVVEAGEHSSSIKNQPLSNLHELAFTFRTNPTWFYSKPEESFWINIKGLSNGHHLKNSSAHLAYQCLDDSLLIIGAYCIVDGVSPDNNVNQKAILDTIRSDSEYECRITREDGRYKFYFEDKYWECPAGDQQEWGYSINPTIDPSISLDHDWMVEMLER